MADYTYDGAYQPHAPVNAPRGASLATMAGALTSLALVIGVGVWGYSVLSRDVSGVHVVRATSGPMRVAPTDPGGHLADHQGLAVNAVAGHGSAEAPAEQLLLAPRPAGLGADDVALGIVVPEAPAATNAALAANAQAMELAVPEIAEDDPVQALANLLAAGAEPLSPLQPRDENAARSPLVPSANASAAVANAPVLTGPGLAQSLRPRLRPAGLRTASVAPLAPSPADISREIDVTTLTPGTRLAQIGAFDTPENARSEWKRLEARFGEYLEGRNRVVQKASSGGRVFYRLRAEGFADLSDARRFCAAFVAQNVDCIPVVHR